MDFTGFPLCLNGDVLIKLAPDKSLQLHADMLKRHSKFFRERISDDSGATLSSTAKKRGESVRWRFDLVERPEDGAGGAGVLSPVALDSWARPHADAILAPADSTGSNTTPALFSYYDKVFGAIYGQTFDLEAQKMTILELLQEVVGIIEVSEYLGCIHAVSNTINAALLSQGQVLWRSVQDHPTAWIDLAMRVRSGAVFAECIIHLVGRWNALTDSAKNALDAKVRELCEKKHAELQKQLTIVECRVLKYYPPVITRPIGAPPKSISRMSYANDIMDWMALAVFRHWFASALAIDRNRRAKDGGFWLYSKLAKGGSEYLGKSEIRSFHEKFPMSTRGEHVIEQHVESLKELVKGLVADVVKNEAQLDVERFPVSYLTCVTVTKEEVVDFWGSGVEALEWGTAGGPAARDSGRKRKGRRVSDEEDLFEEDVPVARKKVMVGGVAHGMGNDLGRAEESEGEIH